MTEDDSQSWSRRTVLKGAAAATGGLVGAVPASATPPRDPGPKGDEILVGTVRGAGTPREIVDDHVPEHATVVHQNETLRYAAVKFPADNETARERFVAAVTDDKRVAYAERNGTVRALYAPDDSSWDDQYAPRMVDADGAWDTTLGSADVTVAIVDQGVQYDHADLEGNMSTAESNHGRDFVDGDGDPYPDDLGSEYHGTHVGGIAAAETDNGDGVAGVSESSLLSVRVLDESGAGTFSDVADGVQWATDAGADVINLSLGASGGSSTLKRAVEYAYTGGVYLVAAAGNDGCSDCVSYPAAYKECAAVSALDPDGSLASYSNTGPEVELCAPGTKVLSTTTAARGDYESLSGTSMATPVVAGCAGLALDQWDLTNAELRTHLNETAVDVGLSGDEQGDGRVDAHNAVTTVPGGGGNGGVETSVRKYAFDHDWVTRGHSSSFASPVTLAKPVSYAGGQPAHARLRNVSSDSFDSRVEEWKYLDSTHATETVSSLTTNAGTGTTADGTPVEAGTVTVTGTGEWSSVSFDQSFSTDPVVVSQVQTCNGNEPVVTRNGNVSTAGFDTTVQEEADGDHVEETIGWLAVEPGTGTLDGRSFEAGRQSGVDEQWHTISFSQSYTEPVFLADMQTTNGGDACALRYRNLGSDSVEVFVEEERSDDDETWHTYETVGFVVAESA